jgi:hypothetical protein
MIQAPYGFVRNARRGDDAYYDVVDVHGGLVAESVRYRSACLIVRALNAYVEASNGEEVKEPRNS